MTPTRVVVTGIGAVSALGENPANQFEALLAGRSGVGRVDRLAEGLTLPTTPDSPRAGGCVPDVSIRAWITDRKSLRAMNRQTHLAFTAADQAIRGAGLTACPKTGLDRHPPAPPAASVVHRDDVGIMIGTGMIDYDVSDLQAAARASRDEHGEFDADRFCAGAWRSIYPLYPVVSLNNATLCQLSMQYQIRGPSASFSPFGESGAQAIWEAVNTIRAGDARAMVAGGISGRVNLSGIARLRAMGALASYTEPAAGTCRPFDRAATGTVPGEAAAMLTLESLSAARERDVPVLAEVLGYGTAVGRGADTASCPSQSAIASSMRAALDAAGVSAADLSCVYATAAGLAADDQVQAVAISEVLGGAADRVPVTSVTGATGHLLAATTPLNCVLATLGLSAGQVPPTVNLTAPVAGHGLHLARGSTPHAGNGPVACLAAGFQGQSACLILSPPAYREN